MDIWILAMVLKIGPHETIVKPEYYVEGLYACLAYKADEEHKPLSVLWTCMREGEA